MSLNTSWQKQGLPSGQTTKKRRVPGAFSKSDFKYKIGICFRESKESNYWLRLIKAAGVVQTEETEYLIKESGELKNIFGSMMKKMQKRLK